MADPLRGGRRLARTEAVISLRRSGNLVVAMVRDPQEGIGRPDVHKARVAVRTFDGAQWARVTQALATKASYAVALLSGSMPADIDRMFAGLGLSVFPTGPDELVTDCSCDDWLRPCAHVAAACYQLATLLDADPFELLALRGRERGPLLDELRSSRPRRPAAGSRSSGRAAPGTSTGDPLPVTVEAFWSSSWSLSSGGVVGVDSRPTGRAGGEGGIDVRSPGGGPDAVLDQCGPLVVESLGDLRERLRPAYRAFATATGSGIAHPGPEPASSTGTTSGAVEG